MLHERVRMLPHEHSASNRVRALITHVHSVKPMRLAVHCRATAAAPAPPGERFLTIVT
jgi:hypothetical protein